MKNIDRIKAMSVEKLLDLLNSNSCSHCILDGNDNAKCREIGCDDGIKQWLESEVEHCLLNALSQRSKPMIEKVCGTCKWKHKDEVGDWYCVNDASENCTDWTEYNGSVKKGGIRMNNWVSIEDRLPKRGAEVLMHIKRIGICIGWIKDNNEWITNEFGLIDDETPVTHWQPLPEPPKR